MDYGYLADLVLIAHTLYVMFIIGGLVLVIAGAFSGWEWVRNFWFRASHLAAIFGVVLLSWLHIICPLTTLETELRGRAGQATYEETFIAHWLHKILFYEAPLWVFSVGYTLFALAVVATWIWNTPDMPRHRTSGNNKGSNNP